MTWWLLFSFFLLAFVPEALSVTAGEGEWSVVLSSPPGGPPSQWASIQQSYKKEWEALTNEFTVQLYVYWFGDQNNNQTNGKEVIIARHMGGEVDGMAHFAIGVLKDPSGEWWVNAWVGCGIALGYSLNSSVPLTPETWTRLALVVNGDGTFETNSSASLYQDGVQVAVSQWNFAACGPRFGIQWQANSEDVRLGYYFNQEASWNSNNPTSIYGFNGLVDELSFFPYPLTIVPILPDEVFEYAGNEPGIVYFQFNEGPRAPGLLQDFTKKLNPELTGRIAIEAALGPLGLVVPNLPTGWAHSEDLQINQLALINGSSVAQTSPILNPIYLSSTGNSSEIYSIVAVSPSLSTLLENGQARIFSDDESLTFLPFSLPSNKVEVVVFCQNGSCNSTDLAFQFDASGSLATVKFSVTPFCPSDKFDACGECDGDNRTCTCACYHGFRTKYMAYELFKFGLQQVVAQTNQTLAQLREVLASVKALGSNVPNQLSATFPARITNERNFGECVSEFCAAFGDFYSNFTSLLPLPERTGLPYDTCSCDPDPRFNV